MWLCRWFAVLSAVNGLVDGIANPSAVRYLFIEKLISQWLADLLLENWKWFMVV